MIPAAAVAGAGVAVALAGGGVLLLRRAWRSHRPVPSTLGGWGLMALATLGWAAGAGWDKAVALALLSPSLAAAPVLAANVTIKRGRAVRPVRGEVELPTRGGSGWRGIVRFIYGAPLAGTAAFTLGAAITLHAPWPPADRLIAGVLLTPFLWALGLIWSIADPRLWRVGAGLMLAVLAGVVSAAS